MLHIRLKCTKIDLIHGCVRKLSFNIHYGEGSVSHNPFGVDLSDFKHTIRCIDKPRSIRNDMD
jgi:hypothetical protein